FPSVGIYHASKWGLEGISQALAHEVKEFGINVTLVEPGGFSTDWSGPSSKRSEPNPAYDALRERQQQWRASNVPGDATASASAGQNADAPNPIALSRPRSPRIPRRDPPAQRCPCDKKGRSRPMT